MQEEAGAGGGAGSTADSGFPRSPTAPCAPPLLPHLLVSCSLDDSRVPFWAPAKWVAAARQLQVRSGRRLKGIKNALGGCTQRRQTPWVAVAQQLLRKGQNSAYQLVL